MTKPNPKVLFEGLNEVQQRAMLALDAALASMQDPLHETSYDAAKEGVLEQFRNAGIPCNPARVAYYARLCEETAGALRHESTVSYFHVSGELWQRLLADMTGRRDRLAAYYLRWGKLVDGLKQLPETLTPKLQKAIHRCMDACFEEMRSEEEATVILQACVLVGHNRLVTEVQKAAIERGWEAAGARAAELICTRWTTFKSIYPFANYDDELPDILAVSKDDAGYLVSTIKIHGLECSLPDVFDALCSEESDISYSTICEVAETLNVRLWTANLDSLLARGWIADLDRDGANIFTDRLAYCRCDEERVSVYTRSMAIAVRHNLLWMLKACKAGTGKPLPLTLALELLRQNERYLREPAPADRPDLAELAAFAKAAAEESLGLAPSGT